MAQHAARVFAGIQAQGAQTLRGWTPWHPSGTVEILHPPDRKTSIELLLTDGDFALGAKANTSRCRVHRLIQEAPPGRIH